MQIAYIIWAGDRKQGIYNWWPNRQPLKYLNLSDINNEQYINLCCCIKQYKHI